MISLAVKYRPNNLNDILGQESIVKILTRQISNNEFKNAYLFAGNSGCGKTTAARAFANALNENIGNPIEIDAASNNGVDNVRTLIAAAYERSVVGKYKIYIIDECHSLTSQAWQAFLKCIEEPPTYTIFIFCTTDPQKIPATILNRVQRFNFTKINDNIIENRLKYICQCENFTNYVDGVSYIAKLSNGSMREAISLLDKCAGYSNDISLDNVIFALGKSSTNDYFKLINALIDCNQIEVFRIFNDIKQKNNDLKLFIEQFIKFCIEVLKYIYFQDLSSTYFAKSYEENLKNCINFETASQWYTYVLDKLLSLKNTLKNDSNPDTTIEIYLTQIVRCVK